MKAYHIDFRDGVDAGDIEAHSNFYRALYHRREELGMRSGGVLGTNNKYRAKTPPAQSLPGSVIPLKLGLR